MRSIRLLLLLAISAQPGLAAIIYVDGSGQTGDFTMIADALAVAKSGDTVSVRAFNNSGGLIVYQEQDLRITKPSVDLVRTPGGPSDHPALIRGFMPVEPNNYLPDVQEHIDNARAQQETPGNQRSVSGSILRIMASDVIVSGFLFQGAEDKGVRVEAAGGARLNDVHLIDCMTYMTFSSGIYYRNVHNMHIANCVVRRACQYGHEECITVQECENFHIYNCNVYDRPRLHNFFPWRSDNGSPSNVNPDSNGNYTQVLLDDEGGPIELGGEGIDAKVGSSYGRIFNNYVAGLDGKFGIYVDGWDKVAQNIDIYNNVVFKCGCGISVAHENGGFNANGAIDSWTANVKIHGNVVSRCVCGIYLNDHGDGAQNSVYNVQIHFNTIFANQDWGILISNLRLAGLSVTNNVAIENGLNDEQTGQGNGGDLGLVESAYSIDIQNNLFTANRAKRKTGVYDNGVPIMTPIPPSGYSNPTLGLSFNPNNLESAASEQVLQINSIWDAIRSQPVASRDESDLGRWWLFEPTVDSAALMLGWGNINLRGEDINGTPRPITGPFERALGAIERN